MKTYKNLFLIFLFVNLVSCEKTQEPKPVGKTGVLKLDVGLSMTIREINARTKAVDTDTFQLIVYNEFNQDVLIFDQISEAPDEIELEEGQYYVVAHSNNLKPAAFENPYYYGRSENFQIIAGESTVAGLECELANCMVSVIYSPNVVENFTSHVTTVSVLSESLVFSESESRPGYFDLMPLSISATLENEGAGGETETKIIEGSIPAPAAKTHYMVTIDATDNEGSLSFTVTVDESVEVESYTFSDGQPVPVTEVAYGDLIVTEIMVNPEAVSDSEGEWVELFNAGAVPVNLNGLKLTDNTTTLIIDEDLILDPGVHTTIAKSETAVADPGFVSSSLSLTNSGEFITLLKPNDEEISSVDFIAVFNVVVEQAGASVSLDPGAYDVELAKDPVNWCPANEAYSTGDLGTPGAINGSCE